MAGDRLLVTCQLNQIDISGHNSPNYESPLRFKNSWACSLVSKNNFIIFETINIRILLKSENQSNMTSSFLKQAMEGNKNAILKQQIICQYITEGDSSITDLSKAINLSVPTVTKLIGELIEEGFVHNFGEQGTAGGRRPNIYGLNPYAGYFIGVELRKDSVALAVINFKGQLIDEKNISFSMSNDPRSLDQLCEVIQNFIRTHKIAHDKILAATVNISGRVNSQTGYSYSYFFVEEQPLTLLLEERLGCTIYIENDTRAATYGEYMYGGAHNEQTMLYINASWGLGLGMIIDGKIFYGKSGFAGEFGHFPLLDNEIICRCGKRGCLETGASGSAMHRIFLEKLRQGSVSMLSGKFNKGEEITLNDILSALHKEDVLAIEVLESVGHTLGKAVAGLINMFNPETIIIGGTLSVAKEYLMLPVRNAVNKYSLMLVNKDTLIRPSTLGERAGVLGACLLARSKSLGLF